MKIVPSSFLFLMLLVPTSKALVTGSDEIWLKIGCQRCTHTFDRFFIEVETGADIGITNRVASTFCGEAREPQRNAVPIVPCDDTALFAWADGGHDPHCRTTNSHQCWTIPPEQIPSCVGTCRLELAGSEASEDGSSE